MESELTYNIVDVLPTDEQLIKFAILANKDHKLGLRSEQNEETAKRFAEYQEQCTAYGIEFDELLSALCVAKALDISSDIELTKEQREEYQTKLSDFIKWRGEYLAETGVVETTDIVDTTGNKEADNV